MWKRSRTASTTSWNICDGLYGDRMKIAPIIDPGVRKPSPKPVRVDLRKVFMFGTALWAIALIVCMVLQAIGFNVEKGQTMCAAGTVIGVIMLVWEHFDRWDYRRLGE